MSNVKLEIRKTVAEFARIRAVWFEQAFSRSVATSATKSENLIGNVKK